MTLPEFDSLGNLPPGEHEVSWTEFAERYGYNQARSSILGQIETWLMHMRHAGCRTVYIDGSFICEKAITMPAGIQPGWILRGSTKPCLTAQHKEGWPSSSGSEGIFAPTWNARLDRSDLICGSFKRTAMGTQRGSFALTCEN